MDFLYGILTGHYSLDALIQWGGYLLLVAIVFAETGLLIGCFLPGDSLLITAGLLAAAGHLNIWWINVLLIVAAIVGDSVGYAIGARLGPRIFTREKSLLFNPSTWCERSSSTRSTGQRPSSLRASCPSSAPLRPSWPAWGRCTTAAS